MQSITHRVPAPRRRRLVVSTLTAVVALVTVTSCSSDADSSTSTSADLTIVPDQTAVAPGACDPAEAVDPPSIETNGTTTLATLGLADIGCAGTNGDGYISFNYNPVLIDGIDAISFSVGDGVAALTDWTGLTPFAETSPGTWASTLDPSSCNRLTIQLTSASGASTATYGADLRVGGDTVACPQRTIDPSEEPTETGGTITQPPQLTDPATTRPPTTAPPTTAPSTTTPRTTATTGTTAVASTPAAPTNSG